MKIRPLFRPHPLAVPMALMLVSSCASGLGWKIWPGQQFPFVKPSTVAGTFEIPVVDHPDSSWAASIAKRLLYGLPEDTAFAVEELYIVDDHHGFVDGFLVKVGPTRIQLGGGALLWIGTQGRAQILAGYQ